MAAWWIHACALRIIKSIIFSDFDVMLIDLPTPSHPLILYKKASNHFESNMDMINWVFEYSSILINISNEFAYTNKNLFNFAIASKFEM